MSSVNKILSIILLKSQALTLYIYVYISACMCLYVCVIYTYRVWQFQIKEKEKELAELAEEQENHDLDTSPIILEQPTQLLNAGMSYSARNDGIAEDEATEHHQNRGNALLPPWMLGDLNG